MNLLALVFYAFTTSTAVSDSDRMAAQFKDQPSLEIVSAIDSTAPVCLEFCTDGKDTQE